jgi:drug/metabolite transporter (DMT)-like permease
MARPLARLEVLAAALLFSTGGAAIKATSPALTGWQVACGRSLVAAAFLALLLPSARRRPTFAQAVAAVPYAATLLLFVLANKTTTAANAIFLQATAPLYLLLLSPLWLGERPRRSDLVLMLALGTGLALFFVGQETPNETAPRPLLGNVLAAASGLTWAFTIASLRRLARDEAGPLGRPGSAAGAALWGNVLVALATAPLATRGPAPEAADVWVLLYLGAFQIGLAYFFLTRAVRSLPALEGALLLLAEPVLNALFAWAAHGEVPGPWARAGALVILGATIAHTGLAARRHRRRARVAGVAGGA